MTDSPRSLSLHRKLARRLPAPVRKAFVRAVERVTRRTWKAGTHHVGDAR